MDVALWAVIVGMLLVLMALATTVLRRLPLSTAMLYVLVGIGVSPLGIGLLRVSPADHSRLLEGLAEGVVLLSLFTAGLKLSAGLRDRSWMLPVRLAVGSMVITVCLIAAAAWMLLSLPLGACVLLGAILAPTDPVLASEAGASAGGGGCRAAAGGGVRGRGGADRRSGGRRRWRRRRAGNAG